MNDNLEKIRSILKEKNIELSKITCCFTGHRPQSLPWGLFDDGIFDPLNVLDLMVMEELLDEDDVVKTTTKKKEQQEIDDFELDEDDEYDEDFEYDEWDEDEEDDDF